MSKKLSLEETRKLVAERLTNKLKSLGDENAKIYCADWDPKRIAWEGTFMSYLESENPVKFEKILTEITKGTGYYIELYNGVEGCLVKE